VCSQWGWYYVGVVQCSPEYQEEARVLPDAAEGKQVHEQEVYQKAFSKGREEILEEMLEGNFEKVEKIQVSRIQKPQNTTNANFLARTI
jgi:hypothetical protein